MSLYVVYVSDTGHVVGAVTASGATAPGDTVEAVVGDALRLRVAVGTQVTAFSLPAGELALLPADDEPGVFDNPLRYGVEPPKPSLVSLKPGVQLTLGADGLSVALPTPASRTTRVLALVSDGQEIHKFVDEIGTGQSTAVITVAVPDGTHAVLVLVAGWAGRLTTVTKS